MIDLIKQYKFYTKSGIKKSISCSQLGSDELQLYYNYIDAPRNPEVLGHHTLGSIIHLGMQQIVIESGANIRTEQQLAMLLPNGWTLTGKYDAFDTDKGILWDFKTGTSFSIKKFNEEKEKHQYTKQMNGYRMLLGEEQVKQMKILWLCKDADVKKGEQVFIISDVPMIDLYDLTKEVIDLTNNLEKADKEPSECANRWMGRVNGAIVPMRCKYYCDYSQHCSYFKMNPTTAISTW